jgi:putative RNA 2'-phosphotransferase
MNANVETSKFLSYVLRHAPESIGLSLDANGWAEIGELIDKARAAGHSLDRTSLETIVAESEKKRFTLSPDGARIRAAQGHSVKVDLAIAPTEPPDVLYHGTAAKSVDTIRRQGLLPQSRQQVHLSPDIDTATKVGARHGVPVVLQVDARGMHEAGLAFVRADNGVWLTDTVPPRYLSIVTGT